MRYVHGVGGAAGRPLIGRAFATSALLSLFFVLVYGSTNWLTSRRPAADVGVWLLPGELGLTPYVPLLILPYMSLDLFFMAAPFLCRSRREMRVLARRVVFSILVATAFFLLLPLRLAWPPRPPVAGLFGDFVEMSCTLPFLMEYPHNLFPSLHVTLSAILAAFYAGHTRGWSRLGLQVWFGVIGFSTVLTWQHHAIDIVGGYMLAGFAVYLFPESIVRHPGGTNRPVGRRYLAGAALLTAAVSFTSPWGVFLLWPAFSLAAVGCGYLGRGPGVFRKADGRLPAAVLFALGPVLVGQWLSLAWYRRRCRAWDVAAPGVRIGRRLSEAEATDAVRDGVTAVLDLTAEFAEPAAFRGVRYLNVPLLDLTAPTPGQLDEIVAFLLRESAVGVVYVHCKAGYSRSAAAVGAYLLASGQVATAEAAMAWLRAARPMIVIRPEIRDALREFERTRRRDVGVKPGCLAGVAL